MHRYRNAVVGLSLAVLAATACNRAALRVPGASADYPPTPIAYVATTTLSATLAVAPAVDRRAQHYDESVAGTRWRACRTDPLWTATAAEIVGARLLTALGESRAFARVEAGARPDSSFVLVPEVHVFCSQAVGFVVLRVAGLTAVRLRMLRGDAVVLDRTFERVVTDADPEYTGAQVTMIEQAMVRTSSDSLRELLREAVPVVVAAAAATPSGSESATPLARP